ncbi:mitochondrial outer membrane protein [Phlyctema vagabunda]|uniref:Mitochondrial outer membrane protein n=1 Tax=Phlyctema vagabunda TaxID=108571 RepID=A0ABR4PK04_9HELO
MPDLSILKSPAPYHILAYGTLLGTQFFQTFVGGITAFRALPRPQFASLQQKIFPIYFGIQTVLPAVVALTCPGSLLTGKPAGISGTIAEGNTWSVLVPVATIFVTSLVNMAVVGPATTSIMRERKHQETRDGKKSYDPAPHSKEMIKLNKRFGAMHGVSSLLNLAGFIATVWYGVSLSERIV